MALACRSHESVHGFFPASGKHWSGAAWTGNPELGYQEDQPGGWHYNILPFMEQGALHDLGLGLTDAERREMGKQMVETPVSAFICPSRTTNTRVTPPVTSWGNINTPSVVHRSDYAGNGGNRLSGTSVYNSRNQTGVIYSVSGTAGALIRDGMSNTYLLGERYLNPDHYNANQPWNDAGWSAGHDHDVIRWTDNNASYAPLRDRAGVTGNLRFGSAHTNFHMALCDGSVQSMTYSIDPEVHYNLGNRADGNSVSGDAF